MEMFVDGDGWLPIMSQVDDRKCLEFRLPRKNEKLVLAFKEGLREI